MNKFLIVSMLIGAISTPAFAQDSSIRDLTLEHFREAFQKGAGKIRIVALLSPT